MQNFLQNIRYAFRTLRKNPGFTLAAILTLALGIGANTAIFSVVESVLLRPLPYPNPHQLVEIFNVYPPQIPRGGLPPGDFADWRDQNKNFSEMNAYSGVADGFNLTGDGEAQRIQSEYVTAGLFPMLGAHPAVGRLFHPEEDRPGNAPVIILSHRLWQSRFGSNPSIVGKSITLDSRRFTVVGVLPANFHFLPETDIWMPLGQFGDDLTEHLHHELMAIARLKPGVSFEQGRDEIASLHRMEMEKYPAEHKNFGAVTQPLAEPGAARMRTTLLVLFGAVGLVLLIACANVVNLLLVRNAGRQREIALRSALGANAGQLALQLLTESTLLALFGGIAGLLLAEIGLRVLASFVPPDLATLHEAQLDPGVLLFALAICLLTGIVCGLVPTFRIFRTDLASALKQGTKGSSARGQRRTHNALVVAEIAMALVPLIGAGLLLRSFQHLIEVDPGFRPEHLLTMEIEQASLSFEEQNKQTQDEADKQATGDAMRFEQIATKIRALPGVKDAGGVTVLPLNNQLISASRFVIEGQPNFSGVRPIAETRYASLGYFATAGIPLLAGRTFTADDFPLQNTVINDAMAKRYWAGQSALGKRINICSFNPEPCWFTVVGVIGDIHQFGLDEKPTYDLYLSGGWKRFLFVRGSGDVAALTSAVTQVVHSVEPSLPISHVQTMDGLLSQSVSPRRFSAVLTGIFAALALLLAAVGIYGVMSYAVAQRTQEIGVRIAMGAQTSDVRRMILGQSLQLAVIGVAIGLVGAFAVARFLATLVFGIGTHDVLTFFGVAVLLIAVAMIASWIPARRAVRVDPLVALRYE